MHSNSIHVVWISMFSRTDMEVHQSDPSLIFVYYI